MKLSHKIMLVGAVAFLGVTKIGQMLDSEPHGSARNVGIVLGIDNKYDIVCTFCDEKLNALTIKEMHEHLDAHIPYNEGRTPVYAMRLVRDRIEQEG